MLKFTSFNTRKRLFIIKKPTEPQKNIFESMGERKNDTSWYGKEGVFLVVIENDERFTLYSGPKSNGLKHAGIQHSNVTEHTRYFTIICVSR